MTHLIDSDLRLDPDGRQVIAQLQRLNVRHAEQLASRLLSPLGRKSLEAKFPDFPLQKIERAIADCLRTSQIPGLRIGDRSHGTDAERPINKWAPRGFGMTVTSLMPRFRLYSTLNMNEPSMASDESAGVAIEFRRQIEPFPLRYEASNQFAIYPMGTLPQPKDQGSRGTCVAFAANSMVANFVKIHRNRFEATDYSEQYLYYSTKQEDDNSDEEGSHLNFALNALRLYGVCMEADLHYRPYIDWSHSLLFAENPHDLAKLHRLAAANRIGSYAAVPFDNLIENIKDCLKRNLSVAAGVLIFQDAWMNDLATWRGEIEMPFIVDDRGSGTLFDHCSGGHAICIVGFEDDTVPEIARPGGGAFIFKNSWGSGWAANCRFGRGYGTIPYEYVMKYCVEAFVLTSLH